MIGCLCVASLHHLQSIGICCQIQLLKLGCGIQVECPLHLGQSTVPQSSSGCMLHIVFFSVPVLQQVAVVQREHPFGFINFQALLG